MVDDQKCTLRLCMAVVRTDRESTALPGIRFKLQDAIYFSKVIRSLESLQIIRSMNEAGFKNPPPDTHKLFESPSILLCHPFPVPTNNVCFQSGPKLLALPTRPWQ
eukprot:1826550-Rhodomonas_salina.1